jgi:hypothetical protein
VAYLPACTLKALHKARNFRDKTTVPLVRQAACRSGDGGHDRRGVARDAPDRGVLCPGQHQQLHQLVSTEAAGVYCFGIDGSGRRVNDTYGNYNFVGLSLHPALYNEREVVRLYNKKNVNYATFLEPAYRAWRFGNQNWTTDIHGTVRPGRVCGSLQGDGKVLATVCIGIS